MLSARLRALVDWACPSRPTVKQAGGSDRPSGQPEPSRKEQFPDHVQVIVLIEKAEVREGDKGTKYLYLEGKNGEKIRLCKLGLYWFMADYFKNVNVLDIDWEKQLIGHRIPCKVRWRKYIGQEYIDFRPISRGSY